MAKDWYLIKSPNSQVSGFEDEYMDNYAQEHFVETLDTMIAETVDLCNQDLSERKTIRVIIENRTADTTLQDLKHQILAPIGTFKPGMYIHRKDGNYWIIESAIDNNGVYEKAVIMLCQYCIRWIDKRNVVHERWANIINSTQYNSGEYSTNILTLESSQYMLTVPNDPDCILIDDPVRVQMDYNTERPNVWKVTQNDNTSYWYGLGGVCKITIAADEEHREDDKLKRICEYDGHDVIHERKPNIGSCAIVYGKDMNVPVGYKRVYKAEFYDDKGLRIEETPSWSVTSEMFDVDTSLKIVEGENKLTISCDDNNLIGYSFTLTLSCGNENVKPHSLNIKIRGLFDG